MWKFGWNLDQRASNWVFAGLGLACLLLILLLEIATEDEELSLLDVTIDAFSTLLTIGAAFGVGLIAHRVRRQQAESATLLHDLQSARAEGSAWRRKVQAHLSGLKDGIDLQFHEWRLTGAERAVGLLILKGLSHKDIARLRATSETTVRQQAQAIYLKANLGGKTAFAAYFLEDLFTGEDLAALPARLSNGELHGEMELDRKLRVN